MAFREIEEAGFELGTFMATYEERLLGLMKRVDKISQALEGMNEEVTKLHKELCKELSEARGVVAIYKYAKELENPVCSTSSAQNSPPFPISPYYSRIIRNIQEKRNIQERNSKRRETRIKPVHQRSPWDSDDDVWTWVQNLQVYLQVFTLVGAFVKKNNTFWS